MSAQVPFLICQQYVLRCPLLMGEDSNKMGFCEAKMSFPHTNEAGLTGLRVSSRDSKAKDAMDVPVLYQRSHCSTRALEEISASSSPLTYHSPSSKHCTAGQSKRNGYWSRTETTSRILVLHPHYVEQRGQSSWTEMSMFQIAVHQNKHHNVSFTLRMESLPLLFSLCITGESWGMQHMPRRGLQTTG